MALKSLFIAKNAYSLVDRFLPHNNSTQIFFPIAIHLLTVSFKIGGVATLSDRYCNTDHCTGHRYHVGAFWIPTRWLRATVANTLI